MSARAALRHEAFVQRQRALAEDVRRDVDRWRGARGYAPPYWALVALARDAVAGRDVGER